MVELRGRASFTSLLLLHQFIDPGCRHCLQGSRQFNVAYDNFRPRSAPSAAARCVSSIPSRENLATPISRATGDGASH